MEKAINVSENNMNKYSCRIYLSKDERWALYDALRVCGVSFTEDVGGEILNKYKDELNDKFITISEHRIIKKNMGVFDFDEEILIKLYEAIDKSCAVNVKLKEGIILNKIYPSRIYLDEDQSRWYLEHIRGGEPFAIWLKKILEVELLHDLSISKGTHEKLRENKKEMHRVKIRVYDEKNSRERAIGFLSTKYIINETKSYGYSDIAANVINLEGFKKWVMDMTPQVVILEPEELKKEFREMVNSWFKGYASGI